MGGRVTRFLPDDPGPDFVWSVMRRAGAAFEKALTAVRVKVTSEVPGDDLDKDIHALRVSARRMDAASTLAVCIVQEQDVRPLNKSVRAARRCAGEVRDCAVQRELLSTLVVRDDHRASAAAAEAIAMLTERRAVAQRELENLPPVRLRKHLRRLKRALFGSRERPASGVLLRRVLARQVAAAGESGTDSAESMHMLRLRLKALRYTLELAGDAAPAAVRQCLEHLTEAQRRLGDANDVHQLAVVLQAWAQKLHESGDQRSERASELARGFERVGRARFAAAADWWAAAGREKAISPIIAWATQPDGVPSMVARTPAEGEPTLPDAFAPNPQRNLWLSGERIAAIDVGSNSIRLIAVELVDEQSWRVITEERAMTRLAHGVDASGMLSMESMAASVEAVGRFKATAERSAAAPSGRSRPPPCVRHRTVATSFRWSGTVREWNWRS